MKSHQGLFRLGEAPALVRTDRGTPILPMSWSKAATWTCSTASDEKPIVVAMSWATREVRIECSAV
jgi:hypothetical protein